jgi:hypothetical protein
MDRVTALGAGTDGAVRRIETAYDVRGLVTAGGPDAALSV